MAQDWLRKIWRNAVLSQLQRLRLGQLTIVDGEETFHFGETHGNLCARVEVHDADFYRRIAQAGGLGAAESFMDGQWSCDDLTTLIRLLIRNSETAIGLDRGWARLAHFLARCGHWLRRNTKANARKNIHAHYDLGNDFFRLFLDDTLSYSCGIFRTDESTLQEASEAKIRHVCRKLELEPGDEVLEIGTGWGALAVHMAAEFGCQVKTTTISREQAALARERVAAHDLQQQVTVQLLDYRDLQGSFDKLVSIEMIEAVGQDYLDEYFRQCSRLLRPDGLMLLQAIVIKDQMLARHASSVDFIGKYIFPGGFLPSVNVISDAVARVTDLRIHDLEELSPHYVRTLRAWRERFWDQIREVRRLGFDERFIRMWDYYLQYCEAAFAERQVNVVQVMLAKPEWALAAKRDPAGKTRSVPKQALRLLLQEELAP